MAKRKRRAFTEDFKIQTVRLVRESGKCIAVVARELDLTESAIRAWVRQAGIDAGRGPAGSLPPEGGAGGISAGASNAEPSPDAREQFFANLLLGGVIRGEIYLELPMADMERFLRRAVLSGRPTYCHGEKPPPPPRPPGGWCRW